jgi:hypothetical protein
MRLIRRMPRIQRMHSESTLPAQESLISREGSADLGKKTGRVAATWNPLRHFQAHNAFLSRVRPCFLLRCALVHVRLEIGSWTQEPRNFS